MAIDIRAITICSLGPLISASINDDYVQGAGLILVTGSCEISGIINPAPGDIVTFSYTQNGITRKIPRKLRVLSSFADPFRRTTSVTLGCKLTYMQDVRSAPLIDGESAILDPKRLQCLNDYVDYSLTEPGSIPFSTNSLMNYCLEKLGITTSSNPLANWFYRDEGIDFSNGYVNILGDLLLSESYCGYLDYNEVLQVFSLDQEGGTGPVLNQDKVIDVSSINTGQLPADTVIVRYNSLSINADEGETVIPRIYSNQESAESWGTPTTIRFEITVFYNYAPDITLTGVGYREVNVIPYTKTITEYGSDNGWDATSCLISSGGPDLSDSVIRREQTKRVYVAEAANSYCSYALSSGADFDANMTDEEKTITNYTYDRKGNLVSEVTEIYVPFFAWIGRFDFYPFEDGELVSFAGYLPVLAQREVVNYEYSYAPGPTYIYLKPGEVFEPEISGQTVRREISVNWGLTQGGAQAINTRLKYNGNGISDYLSSASAILVPQTSEVNVNSNRLVIGGRVRQAYKDPVAPENGSRIERTDQVTYVTGSSEPSRVLEFSIPYQADDYLGPANLSGVSVVYGGKANLQARKFGRVQNKLLHGNRYGINIQTGPTNLPTQPFSPFILQANGLSALYRTNGTSWTIDQNGIVLSTDALFWGAIGGTGNFWFPVSPGVVSLPETPATEDTSPDAVIGTVETVGSNPQTTLSTAFPDAIAGDGVQDETTDIFWVYDGTTWENVGQNPGPTMAVTTVIPPWNELVSVDATTKTVLGVESFNYGMELLTEVAPTVKTKLNSQGVLGLLIPAAQSFTLAAIQPLVTSSLDMRPPAADITVIANVPVVGQEVGVYVAPPAATSVIDAFAPVAPGSLQIRPPVADIAIIANAPAVGRFVGVYMDPPAAAIAVEALAPTRA